MFSRHIKACVQKKTLLSEILFFVISAQHHWNFVNTLHYTPYIIGVGYMAKTKFHLLKFLAEHPHPHKFWGENSIILKTQHPYFIPLC